MRSIKKKSALGVVFRPKWIVPPIVMVATLLSLLRNPFGSSSPKNQKYIIFFILKNPICLYYFYGYLLFPSESMCIYYKIIRMFSAKCLIYQRPSSYLTFYDSPIRHPKQTALSVFIHSEITFRVWVSATHRSNSLDIPTG